MRVVFNNELNTLFPGDPSDGYGFWILANLWQWWPIWLLNNLICIAPSAGIFRTVFFCNFEVGGDVARSLGDP